MVNAPLGLDDKGLGVLGVAHEELLHVFVDFLEVGREEKRAVEIVHLHSDFFH